MKLPSPLPAAIPALFLLLSSAAAAANPRVVTLSPHLAELACAAGACDRLVGVSAWSDFPPQVKTLPQIGDGFSVDYERVLALHPDIVLAWDGGTPPATIARLRGLGLKVDPVAAASLDDVAAALDRIGRDLGTETAAQAAAQAYRARLAALRARWQDAPPIRVVYQIGTAPAYTVNAKSPISAALALCGGVNVFASMPQIAEAIGAEAMLAANPEVVLYADSEDAAAMQAWWARLPGAFAAQHGTLYGINADLLARATPRLLDGTEQVCTTLERARQKLNRPLRNPAPESGSTR